MRALARGVGFLFARSMPMADRPIPASGEWPGAVSAWLHRRLKTLVWPVPATESEARRELEGSRLMFEPWSPSGTVGTASSQNA